jgi:hypothetical protein
VTNPHLASEVLNLVGRRALRWSELAMKLAMNDVLENLPGMTLAKAVNDWTSGFTAHGVRNR